MAKNCKGSKMYKNFILSYVVTLLFPMLIMSIIVLSHFVNILKEEVELNLRNPFIKSIDNFDAQIDQLTKTSLHIELNDFLRNVNIHQNPLEAINIKNELLKYNTNSFVDEIFIYNYNDDYVLSCNYLCTLNVFNSFILDPAQTDFNLMKFWNSTRQSGLYFFPAGSINLANVQSHLMYLNKIPVHNTRSYGIIMYMIPESSLRKCLDPAFSANSYLFIMDPETEEILFHFSDANDQGLMQILEEKLPSAERLQEIDTLEVLGKRYSTDVYESSKVPYIFIRLMPDHLLSFRINQIRTFYLIAMTVIIVLSGTSIAILMRINYRPIGNLKKLLEDTLQFSWRSPSEDKLNELELLENALLQYNKENTDLKEYSSASRDAVKSYLIDCFLSGQAHEIDNILETCRKAGLSFDKSFYCTIVVKGSVMLNISDDALHDIRASVISGDKVQMLFHRDIHNNSIVILLGNSINDKNLARSTALLFSNLLNEEYGNNFRVGVGSFYDSIFHVDTSYEEAIRVLDHNNIFAQKNIICFSDIQKKIEQNIQYPFTLFDNLEASIQKNDIFSIQDSINQLVYFIRNKNLSLFWAKNICYDTVNTISKKLIKRYDHSPFLNKPYMERIYGKDIVTFDDIESLMKGISENVVNYLKADTESYELKLLQQIIKHIRNNYLDPDFSLQSLADSLQMSTPYLSQYFKKNTNYTISEYVTRLRMERAKDLLIKTNISVRDIAIEVGYYSVSSFIRKFREKESITPGQFKKKYS